MPDETDLWNLDDELPPSPEPLPQETPPPPASKIPPAAADEVTRIETPDTRRRARNAAKLREAEATAEASATALQPGTNPMAAMPKSAPSGLGMTEDEIWSDFIDDEPPAPAPASVTTRPTPVPPPSKLSEVKTMPVPAPAKDAKMAPASPQPAAPAPAETAVTAPPAPPDTEEVVADTDENTETESFETLPTRTSTKSWQITRFSRLETLLSLAFLLLLVGGGFWSAQLFRQHVRAQADPYSEPEFPAKGALAMIETAETYWRPPVKEGPDADPTQREVILIPVIDITLGSCASPSGVIRVMFTNDMGDIVGDTITRAYRDSRFASNDSPTASFPSTTGFTNFGEQEAYRAYLGNPWSIRVYEGPDETAPSSAFRLLFSTPISTKRR